jgi:hypothetical protein
MATNPPKDNSRIGMVRQRSQTFNPVTQTWVKRDAKTGLFMDVKSDGTPWKGVRKKNKAALKISVLPYLSEYTTLFAELSALKLK